MVLDLSSLEKAVSALARALRVFDEMQQQQANNTELLQVLRAGVIQSFEFAYELSYKMLRRFLQNSAASSDEISSLSFRSLLRRGAAQGLIADPQRWFEFRENRNISSHSYDDGKAQIVFAAARDFIVDAQDLLARLQEQNRDD